MPIAGNKMWKVQVPPMRGQIYNAAFGLLYKSSFGSRNNLSLRPLSLTLMAVATVSFARRQLFKKYLFSGFQPRTKMLIIFTRFTFTTRLILICRWSTQFYVHGGFCRITASSSKNRWHCGRSGKTSRSPNTTTQAKWTMTWRWSSKTRKLTTQTRSQGYGHVSSISSRSLRCLFGCRFFFLVMYDPL